MATSVTRVSRSRARVQGAAVTAVYRLDRTNVRYIRMCGRYMTDRPSPGPARIDRRLLEYAWASRDKLGVDWRRNVSHRADFTRCTTPKPMYAPLQPCHGVLGAKVKEFMVWDAM